MRLDDIPMSVTWIFRLSEGLFSFMSTPQLASIDEIPQRSSRTTETSASSDTVRSTTAHSLRQ